MYRKKLRYSIFVLPIVVLCIGLILSLTGIFDYPAYTSAEDITATVTDYERHASETVPRKRRTTYTMYVDYAYNGTTYSHIQWETRYAPVDVGTQVPIKISPETPAEPIANPPLTFILIGTPFVIAGLILSFKLIPAIRSGKQFFVNVTVSPNSKTKYVYVLLPLVVALAFLYGGIKSDPLFLIGTLIGILLSVFAWETLLREED